VPVTTTTGTAYTDVGLSPSTTYQYVVVAVDTAGNESNPAGPRNATTSDLAPGDLILAGSAWRYRDNGSNQGTGWRSGGFNDSGWPTGSAEFGFGDGDETTVIREGFITYYFRRSFEPQGGVTGEATLTVRRDDGVVVYINGTEVFRNNMPGGTIGYLTKASTTIGGSGETTWLEASVPASVFKSGTNVIAVEVHQVNAGSSDVSFDLSLHAEAELKCDGETVTIRGTSGDDVIPGTSGRDVIHGLGGDDVITGLGGNDVLCGGGGNDRLVGGSGNDVLIGGSGKDVLLGKNGRDRLEGKNGADRLDGGRGHDTLKGGNGIDEASFSDVSDSVDADLVAGTSTGQGTDSMASIERLRGSSKPDTLRGDAGSNRLIGGGGGDALFGRGGDDVLLGKSGGDDLFGGGGADLLEGGKGNDDLNGGSGFDTLRGGSGTDTCSNGEVVSGC
jgi:Ca2+-binding RTX toxin-like protein